VGRLHRMAEAVWSNLVGSRGARRWPVTFAVLAVGVGGLGLSGCVADPPPSIGTATPGDGSAVVSWHAPLAAPSPITAYVVTPWIGFVRQTPVVFTSPATTQTVTGLTNGVTYRFTVHAIDALGNDSASSGMSNPVTPQAVAIVAGGYGHTCALPGNGTVRCWGLDDRGQLGNGGPNATSLIPVTVTGISTATTVAAGERHACAGLADGTVRCWGRNLDGQLGNGTTNPSSTPVTVTGISTATTVAAGFAHTCAGSPTGP
jgi:hypothetical protein